MSGVTRWEPDEWTAPTPTLFAAIAKYRYAIVGVVAVAVILGYVVSSARTPVYEATTTLFLSDSVPFGGGAVDPTRKVQQEASRLSSRSVFDSAAETLDIGLTRLELEKRVTIESNAVSGLIEVTAGANDAQTAADIANAVTESYREISRSTVARRVEQANEVLAEQADQLSARIEDLQALVDVNPSNASAERRLETSQAQLLDLQSSVSQMAADAALYGSGVADVEQAVAPAEPSSPKPSRDAALGGVLALAAASAVAYWRAGTIALSHVDSTAVLGAPLLAQIPAFRRSTDGPVSNPLFDAEATEAYQFLLSSFEYALAQSGARSVLITSALPGDGKSLTALHLARALTVQGNDVVLVDSDIRTRGLTRLLRADDEPGLSGMADGLDLHNAVRRYRIVESTYLLFVPAGESPEQATGLLATGRYRRAITEILSSSELTIVDGSALLTVADASAVATQVDGVLLVLRADASSDDLLRVQERLRLISTPLIGYVVNRVADDGSSSPLHGTSETNRVRRLLNSSRSDHVAEPGTRPKA